MSSAEAWMFSLLALDSVSKARGLMPTVIFGDLREPTLSLVVISRSWPLKLMAALPFEKFFSSKDADSNGGITSLWKSAGVRAGDQCDGIGAARSCTEGRRRSSSHRQATTNVRAAGSIHVRMRWNEALGRALAVGLRASIARIA